ncbi:MAG: hypothetical protein QXK76_01955 [Candidatus Woesearchaeota archaeon]
MDYRLVPYIKKYLHEGHSLEEIKQSLLNQGIPYEDIKQATIYAMDEGTKEIKISHKKTWIISFIIIIGLLSTAYFFQEPIIGYSKNIIDKNFFSLNNINMQDTSNECNMDCLIKSSTNCDSAKTIFEQETELFGMIIKSIQQYEINKQENNCVLKIGIIDADVEFSEELLSQAYSNGVSQEEITIQLQESKNNVKETIGKEGTCIFEKNNNLKIFLEKTNSGTFSGSISCKLKNNCAIIQNTNNCEWECTYDGDWALGKCTGTLFSE